ncbi:MAG: NAD(P)H-hydrate dehydratase [Deltaproteobacteria bacterium]|nr:NAD(P)H-hydrate dehydratase [Deltaproteobacteria bacterium]
MRAFLLGSPDRFSDHARQNYTLAKAVGVPIEEARSADAIAIVEATAEAEIIVDAIFGTGLTREVTGIYREAIAAINASSATVMAVDIPSGVNGNTGAVHGVAVEADYTVTFGLAKQGNLLYPGAAYGGELAVSPISFPPAFQKTEALSVYLEMPKPLLPRRPDGHKGSFGDGLVIAGGRSYYGAPMFASMAMLRAGAGYARLAAPPEVTQVVGALAPELVFLPQDNAQGGALSLACADDLVGEAEAVDVVVLGPGVGLAPETRELVMRLAAEVDKPLILDGDGLTAVAEADEGIAAIAGRVAPTVLTPHLGEAARLLGSGVAEVQADLIAAAREVSSRFEAIVVLKGAHSLIALPDGRVFINPSGNAGMATAGAGDVLAGTIAAMFGLGLSPVDATRCGVFLHGLAGDIAATERRGEDGLVARDLLDALPAALRRYREDYDALAVDVYGACRLV